MESIRVIQAIMSKLDLRLSKEKSRLVNIWNDKDGFDFLGFHNRKFLVRNKGGSEMYVLCHIPSKKAMKKMRQQVKEYLAPRNKLYIDIQDLVKGLNRKVHGWRNYYSISPIAKRWLNHIDWYILERLNLFWNKKRNKRHKHARLGEVMKMTKHTLAKLAA